MLHCLRTYMFWITQQIQRLLERVAEIFETLIELWAVIRVSIILILVLYTIVINIHDTLGKKCEKLSYEKIDVIAWNYCYHVQCRGGCHP